MLMILIAMDDFQQFVAGEDDFDGRSAPIGCQLQVLSYSIENIQSLPQIGYYHVHLMVDGCVGVSGGQNGASNHVQRVELLIVQILLMDSVYVHSLPRQEFGRTFRQAAMQSCIGNAFTASLRSADLYRSLQVVHLGACGSIDYPKLGCSQLLFDYPMCNRTMLVERVALQNNDEFHVLLLLGRKSVMDIEEGVILLMSTRALPDVENEITSLKLQHFLPTTVAT